MEFPNILKKKEERLFSGFKHLKRHHQYIFALILSIAGIFIWRGSEYLMSEYWLPNNFFLSAASGLILGAVLLVLAHKVMQILA